MPLEDIYTKFPNYWQGSNNGLMQPLPLNTPIVYFSKFEGWVKDNDKYQAVCDKMLNESKYGILSDDEKLMANKNQYATLLKAYKADQVPEFKEFFDWLQPRIKEVLLRWSYPTNIKFRIGQNWINDHYTSKETMEHTHGSTTLVVTSYINKTAKSGNISFRDPMHEVRAHEDNPQATTPWREIPASTGHTIMFPGWLPHKTAVSGDNTRRLTFTSNIHIIPYDTTD